MEIYLRVRLSVPSKNKAARCEKEAHIQRFMLTIYCIGRLMRIHVKQLVVYAAIAAAYQLFVKGMKRTILMR